jgi:hypothetical protein
MGHRAALIVGQTLLVQPPSPIVAEQICAKDQV